MISHTGTSNDGATASTCWPWYDRQGGGEEQASEVDQAVRYVALGRYLEEIAKGLQGGAPGVQEWRTAWFLPALRAGEDLRA
jgi:hypothetical protein